MESEPSQKSARVFSTKVNAEGKTENAAGAKPQNNYMITFMHLVKGYVGTGIFALGQAFRNSGIIVGIVSFISLAILNLNCQHMLITAATKVAGEEEGVEVRPTFAETVEYTMESSKVAFLKRNSKRLGLMTSIFLFIAELGFCCVYFVFVEAHFTEIGVINGFFKKDEPINDHIMLAIILVPMWLSTFVGNLRMLGAFSITANILQWIAVLFIYYFTIRDIGDASEVLLVGSYKTMPLFFGTALYAFEGITFIINLRNEMKDPSEFVSVCGILNAGMVFVASLFLSVGLLSYCCYQNDIRDSVFMNFPPEEILSQATQGIAASGVLFTFTLHMYIAFEISYPLFYSKFGPFKHSKLVIALYKSTSVLFTYFLANVVPFLGLFISLVGSSTGAIIAFIIPATLELTTFHGQLRKISVVKDYAIIIFGILGLIIGTGTSIWDIVTTFEKRYKQ